jgi:glycosyltransferase involved in cell wall biosynthesis
MPSVLHLLPHPGGGSETYVDLLEGLSGYRHARMPLASAGTAAAAATSLPGGLARAARAARRADLVHAHGDVAAALASPVLRSRPSVWTTHGLHFLRRADGPAGIVGRTGVRAAAAATGRTICTSQAERAELSAVVGRRLEARLVTVRNGIAPHPPAAPGERAAARRALDLPQDVVVALFLGELDARKAPLVAVAAARRAQAAGAPLVLLLAGDGPQAAEVAAQAGPGVRALGFRRDVGRLLDAADLLVMPSEREGLAFAVLEAMGRGLAPVVSDGAGNPEAVGPDGLVLPVGDVDAFAAAFERLARDPEERARLGAAARARVATELTADRLLEGVRAAYEAVLAGPPEP